jgi:hypothetical protein
MIGRSELEVNGFKFVLESGWGSPWVLYQFPGAAQYSSTKVDTHWSISLRQCEELAIAMAAIQPEMLRLKYEESLQG